MKILRQSGSTKIKRLHGSCILLCLQSLKTDFFHEKLAKRIFKLFVTHYFSCLDKKFDRSKKSTINSGLKFSKEERALTA